VYLDLSGARLFVAGPPPMVDAVKALALERGVAADRIHADAFFAAEPPKRSLWKRITGVMPMAA
jgi:ferredoxin-NADP reductase